MVIRNGKIEYEPTIDFWVAQNRVGLLNYLTQQYPQDASKFLAMKKNRLTAIYINVRRKRG